MLDSNITLFAQAIVNRGKCNSVDAVLDDYDATNDSFYYYKSDYQLFKEVLKLQYQGNKLEKKA